MTNNLLINQNMIDNENTEVVLSASKCSQSSGTFTGTSLSEDSNLDRYSVSSTVAAETTFRTNNNITTLIKTDEDSISNSESKDDLFSPQRSLSNDLLDFNSLDIDATNHKYIDTFTLASSDSTSSSSSRSGTNTDTTTHNGNDSTFFSFSVGSIDHENNVDDDERGHLSTTVCIPIDKILFSCTCAGLNDPCIEKKENSESPVAVDSLKSKVHLKEGDVLTKGNLVENETNKQLNDQLEEEGHLTDLFSSIDTKTWHDAIRRLCKNPEEARMWVHSKHSSSNTDKFEKEMKLLPLHAACFFGAPLELVADLIKAYPGGVRQKLTDGRLPIHIACETAADSEIVFLLLHSWPESIYSRDDLNISPLQYSRFTEPGKSRDQIIEVLTTFEKENDISATQRFIRTQSQKKKSKVKDSFLLSDPACNSAFENEEQRAQIESGKAGSTSQSKNHEEKLNKKRSFSFFKFRRRRSAHKKTVKSECAV